MSVENVPTVNRLWFVLRVSYGRIIKAKAFIETKGLKCYVPMLYKEVGKRGKRQIITEPLIPSFLFVHASAKQVESLLQVKNSKDFEYSALSSYYYDHTSHCENAPTKNSPLVISDVAMDNLDYFTISRCSNFIFTLKVRCRDANILIVGWNIADYVIEDEEYNRVRGRAFNVKVTLSECIKYFENLLIYFPYVS